MAEPRPIQAVMPFAAAALDRLRPWVDRIEIAGSIRRCKAHVKDIEIVAVPSLVSDGLFGEPRPAIAEIRQVAESLGPIAKGGERYIQVADVLGSGVALDLFLVHPPAEWGPIFAIRTGPADYSERLVTRLRGRLWKCEAGHVLDDHGAVVPCPEEEDFLRACGVDWLEPRAR